MLKTNHIKGKKMNTTKFLESYKHQMRSLGIDLIQFYGGKIRDISFWSWIFWLSPRYGNEDQRECRVSF